MRKDTELKVFYTTTGEEIVLPTAVIEGTKPGPNVLITAGIHGCEYPGIAAAMTMFQTLKPEEVSGTITIITITSMKSFEERRMFVCPVDNKNPNRFFPGKTNGTYTEQHVKILMDEFISKADLYLDLHGGDMVEDLEDFAIYHTGKNDEIDQKSYEIAKYYLLRNAVATTTDGAWPDNGTSYANASELGVPAAIVEAGGIGQLTKEATDTHLRGLYNVFRHFGILEGKSKEPTTFEVFKSMKWLYIENKGFFYCNVKSGDEVVEGQIVGRLVDYFGNVIEEPRANTTGRVVFCTTSPAMREKGLIMAVAYR